MQHMTTIYDDKQVLIITHKLGDISIDKKNHYLKARCIGQEGFKQQMRLLKQIYRGMTPYDDEE